MAAGEARRPRAGDDVPAGERDLQLHRRHQRRLDRGLHAGARDGRGRAPAPPPRARAAARPRRRRAPRRSTTSPTRRAGRGRRRWPRSSSGRRRRRRRRRTPTASPRGWAATRSPRPTARWPSRGCPTPSAPGRRAQLRGGARRRAGACSGPPSRWPARRTAWRARSAAHALLPRAGWATATSSSPTTTSPTLVLHGGDASLAADLAARVLAPLGRAAPEVGGAAARDAARLARPSRPGADGGRAAARPPADRALPGRAAARAVRRGARRPRRALRAVARPAGRTPAVSRPAAR